MKGVMGTAAAPKYLLKGESHTRLPRVRSTPSFGNWVLQADNADFSAGLSLAHPSTGSWSSNRSQRASTRFDSFMSGQRPYHTGRHRVKADLRNAMATRDQHTQLRRLRQVASANRFNQELHGEVKKADLCISELSRRDPIEPSFSDLAEKALLGIETPAVGVAATGADAKSVARELGGISRQFSIASTEAIEQLEQLGARLVPIEDRVAELNRLAQGPQCLGNETLGQMKTELAQLEAEANKLETKGVDSIYTSELRSGQEIAKQLKKAQLRRLESLFALIEQLFRVLNSKI